MTGFKIAGIIIVETGRTDGSWIRECVGFMLRSAKEMIEKGFSKDVQKTFDD